MAFPIPEHLPRKQSQQLDRDIATKILAKLDGTTYQTLNAKIASEWVEELKDGIRATKVC